MDSTKISTTNIDSKKIGITIIDSPNIIIIIIINKYIYIYIYHCFHEKRSSIVINTQEKLLQLFAGSVINYSNNATEIAWSSPPKCSRLQPATNNCVRDSIDCPWTPTVYRIVTLVSERTWQKTLRAYRITSKHNCGQIHRQRAYHKSNHSRKMQLLFRMLSKICNSCTSVVPNTCEREQQNSNNTDNQR